MSLLNHYESLETVEVDLLVLLHFVQLRNVYDSIDSGNICFVQALCTRDFVSSSLFDNVHHKPITV